MQVLQEIRIEVPSLGRKIKEARIASGRSIRRIAKEVGVSHVSWQGFERERHGIKLETLRRIEEVLGVSLLD